MALGSRLRRLSEKFTEDAAKIYALYDIFWSQVFPPSTSFCKRKSFPLQRLPKLLVIRTHQSVRLSKKWRILGLRLQPRVYQTQDNVVKLSDRGQQLIPTIKKSVHRRNPSCGRTCWGNAVRLMEGDWGNGVFAWKKTLYSCKRKRKARESQQVEIIDYSPFTKTSSVWTTSGLRNTSNWSQLTISR